MPRVSSLRRNLFHRDRAERDLTEEVRAYLELLIEEKISEGLNPKAARRAALIELGGVDQLKERVREARSGHHLDVLWQDLRFAARSLRRHALLSTAVVGTLTLGIGISAGVFTYYDAEFLRAKVDRDFDSFVQVYSAYTKDAARPGRPGRTTLEDYLAFRDQVKSIGKLTAYADFRAPLGRDDPVEVRTLLVTSDFFSLYDLERPLMGRVLQPEDSSPAATPVVVLSERLWRTRFESDREIVGKIVHFNDQPVTVVGVTPNFAGMVNNARAWFPYTLETYLKHGEDLLHPGEAAWLQIAGRLNPGFSRQEAAAELKLLAAQQDRLHPGRMTALTVTNGSYIQIPEDRQTIALVFAVIMAALIVFVLIVCVNVATLLLARAAGRRQEIAARLALGAGRIRLIRMLLTETFLLASVAGLLSVYLAYHIPGILDRWLTTRNEAGGTWYSLAPDWRAFGYLALVTILGGVMAGLTPALQSMKVNLSEMLKGRQTLPGGARSSWLYGLLIGAQCALSFILLYGASFSVSAARKAASFEPGFETRRVLWTDMFMQSAPTRPRDWISFQATLTGRLTALPGVESVAYSNRYPFQDSRTIQLQAPGQPVREAAVNWVSPDYFTTLGIPIVSGRAIAEGDSPRGRVSCPVVVSMQLARLLWPDQNSLGKTLSAREGNYCEVVGVASDVSSMRLGGLDDPMIYKPLDLSSTYPSNVFVRFSGDSASVARAVSGAVRDLAPELTIFRTLTIQAFRDELMENLGRQTQFVSLLCAMAVLLALIGIYGVVAFAVSQRTKEMGIRLALGAQKRDIYRAVLGSSGRPVAVGLSIGLGLTVGVFSQIAPLLRGAEFAASAQDPANYVLTGILLAAAALAAMLVPARKATLLDPMMTLRDA
jgi:predicted permease